MRIERNETRVLQANKNYNYGCDYPVCFYLRYECATDTFWVVMEKASGELLQL